MLQDQPQPNFNFMTTPMSTSKDSDGSSELSMLMMKKQLSTATLAHCGGAITDNASDALLEIDKTFNEAMGAAEEHDVTLQMRSIDRCIIKSGDPGCTH